MAQEKGDALKDLLEATTDHLGRTAEALEHESEKRRLGRGTAERMAFAAAAGEARALIRRITNLVPFAGTRR